MLGKVVTGNVLQIHQAPVRIFDSGALHCFIFASFIAMHSVPSESLDVTWSISTGNGALPINRQCRDCSIVVNRRGFFANFLVLDSSEFDAILGM